MSLVKLVLAEFLDRQETARPRGTCACTVGRGVPSTDMQLDVVDSKGLVAGVLI